MRDQPSSNELLDDISLNDVQEESDSTADFELDGISAEEMADDAEQQEHQESDRPQH